MQLGCKGHCVGGGGGGGGGGVGGLCAPPPPPPPRGVSDSIDCFGVQTCSKNRTDTYLGLIRSEIQNEDGVGDEDGVENFNSRLNFFNCLTEAV